MDCKDEVHKPSEELFSQNCKTCGCLPCYADDAIYTVASPSRTWNQNRIKIILDRLTTFLNSNKLTINKTKTVLQELMLAQKRCKLKGVTPSLLVKTDKGDIKEVTAKNESIFLGATLQDNLKWKAHIESGEEPMLSHLRRKLGGLKYLAKEIPEKSKLILANGLILSKILYLLPLYGGTYDKYLSKIQVIMNDTVRFIKNKNRRTSTRPLMELVGWLDIKELVDYHSLLMMWRILRIKKPKYFENKIKIENDEKISTSFARLKNTESGFRWRTIPKWNSLSLELRKENSYPRFKRNLKKWILKQRPPN